MPSEAKPTCPICEDPIRKGQFRVSMGKEEFHLDCLSAYEGEFQHFQR